MKRRQTGESSYKKGGAEREKYGSPIPGDGGATKSFEKGSHRGRGGKKGGDVLLG